MKVDFLFELYTRGSGGILEFRQQICSYRTWQLKKSEFEELHAYLKSTRSDKRLFVALLLGILNKFPKDFLKPMIEACISEDETSIKSYFIDPCIRMFGVKIVNEEILSYFKTDNKNIQEKESAIESLYYVKDVPFIWNEHVYTFVPDYLKLKNGEYEIDINEDIRVRKFLLEEFINNPDLSIKRSLVWAIPEASPFLTDKLKVFFGLKNKWHYYPKNMRSLIRKTRDKAKKMGIMRA